MDGPILLFDGTCNLCHGGVRWVIARDERGVFRFASLDSEAARRVLAEVGHGETLPDSMVLVRGGEVFVLSDAAIEVGRALGLPWSALTLAKVLPRRIRDGIYRWVARNRHRWFGRKETCSLPPPGELERSLDAEERG